MSDRAKKFKGRDEILAAKDLTTEELFVEEWDTWVRIRVMSGKERQTWGQVVKKFEDSGRNADGASLLASMTLVDEAGALLFPGEEGIDLLAEKSARSLHGIALVAMRINKLTEKDVQETEKN